MIKMFHIYKRYDDQVSALSDITLQVSKGEFVFITGPSGAGKTTLLKLILGAETPSEGQIIVDGRNQSRIRRRERARLRKRIGFVFQEFKLLPSRTVYENVALSLRVMGIAPGEIRLKVMRALSYVGLRHKAAVFPLSLSGGEKQRVAIARAIVKEPVVLLADEPTGNLDHELALSIMELFNNINIKGTTVVLATHDTAMIENTGRRVLSIHQGRISS